MTRRSKISKGTEQETPVAESQPTISKSIVRRVEAEGKVILTATIDTQLPDGKFVPKGKSVAVSKEFAERLKKASDKSFIIN